jgi:hypothetical protein
MRPAHEILRHSLILSMIELTGNQRQAAGQAPADIPAVWLHGAGSSPQILPQIANSAALLGLVPVSTSPDVRLSCGSFSTLDYSSIIHFRRRFAYRRTPGMAWAARAPVPDRQINVEFMVR